MGIDATYVCQDCDIMWYLCVDEVDDDLENCIMSVVVP